MKLILWNNLITVIQSFFLRKGKFNYTEHRKLVISVDRKRDLLTFFNSGRVYIFDFGSRKILIQINNRKTVSKYSTYKSLLFKR